MDQKYKKSLSLLFIILLYSLVSYKSRLYLTDLFFNGLYRIILIKNIEKVNLCKPLQQRLERATKFYRNNISVSVVNNNAEIIGDLNGDVLRIPASNQKLISTGYALSKLGPNYKLKTTLTKKGKNDYFIFGQGDPDLDTENIKKIAISIVNDINDSKNKINNNNNINITLFEEANDKWWNKTWSYYDRQQEYGAPITRLAISSNSNIKAVTKPIRRFQTLLSRYLRDYNFKAKYRIQEHSDSKILENKLITKIESAPLYALMSLANSESHNFTAEVLYRNALPDWDIDSYNKDTLKWLRKYHNYSVSPIYKDASGLSRGNRITTRTLSYLMKNMDSHRYRSFYKSSLSILGVRGTLSRVNFHPKLYSKFLGKSGTLNKVKSITGILEHIEGDIYISLIANNMDNSLPVLLDLLFDVYESSTCSE